MAETPVLEPESAETLAPGDGERYVRALADSVTSGPDFWTTLVDLNDDAETQSFRKPNEPRCFEQARAAATVVAFVINVMTI